MTLAERLAQADVSGLPDPAAADVLNAPNAANGAYAVDVAVQDIYTVLLGTAEWGRIEWASRFAPTGTLASPSAQDLTVIRCITLVRAVQNGGSLKTSDPAVGTAYGALSAALVTAGLMQAATLSNLLTPLGLKNKSWAQANGFPNGVTARDIGLARGSR
jgi:hypothetical protein